MTPNYARALLAVRAEMLRVTIDEVAKIETDQIALHKLAEVRAECEWCERTYKGKE